MLKVILKVIREIGIKRLVLVLEQLPIVTVCICLIWFVHKNNALK